MKRHFTEITAVCFSFGIDFKTFVGQHETSLREYMSSRMNLFLAEHTYSVRKRLGKTHADYLVCELNDVEDAAKVLGNRMKSKRICTFFAKFYYPSFNTSLLLCIKRKRIRVSGRLLKIHLLRSKRTKLYSCYFGLREKVQCCSTVLC